MSSADDYLQLMSNRPLPFYTNQESVAWEPNTNDRRQDGSLKGRGWLGILPTMDEQGNTGVMSEKTIGVNIDGKEYDIPAIVPTLSEDELSHLAKGGKITDSIVKKAVDHALPLIREGKSPFADNPQNWEVNELKASAPLPYQTQEEAIPYEDAVQYGQQVMQGVVDSISGKAELDAKLARAARILENGTITQDPVNQWLQKLTGKIPMGSSGFAMPDRFVRSGTDFVSQSIEGNPSRFINPNDPEYQPSIYAEPSALPSLDSGGVATQIKAFHGSPYKFSKFDMSKVGTGEGAQAFGHGLYFTDEKAIAKSYAKSLQNKGVLTIRDESGKMLYQGDGIDDKFLEATKWIDVGRRDAGEFPHNTAYYAKKAYERSFSRYPEMLQEPDKQAVLKAIDKIGNGKISYEDIPGHTYEVTLHAGKSPGEYDYLRWDEPVPHNTKLKITEQLKDGDIRQDILSKRYNGEGLYRTLSESLGSDEAASKFLLNSGIDGIQYPAGTLSGGNKTGAYNYVVFDDRAVTPEVRESLGGLRELLKPLDISGQ